MIYYNDNNKSSHDSNHAILYTDKIDNLDIVLDDISEFYLQRGITPRIYHPYINGFLEQNKQIFLNHGYDIEIYDSCQYMLLTGENKINVTKRLSIKRLREWDERIASQIFIPNDKEYAINVIKEAVKNEKYHLFVGYLDDIVVTVASIFYSNYGCARLDDVETAITQRNNGYSRELISHLVEYHKENSKAAFYLWAENPTAIKIYTEAGFTLMPIQYEAWAAVYNGEGQK
ncbi:MAG: GNAT family N-acetyltransferase [Bacillota bacterium]|nr:GNAT family N-acetyltransferase [Bacillota bacterium]